MVCTDLYKIIQHCTEITSLVVGFDLDLSAFKACKSIQCFGLIGMGLYGSLSWDEVVRFLADHQPRAVHIESCNFKQVSSEDIQQNSLPQPTTLSLLDYHSDMECMKGVGPVFPNVTSLCITTELLSILAGFGSLRDLTLVNPSCLSECMPLPQIYP